MILQNKIKNESKPSNPNYTIKTYPKQDMYNNQKNQHNMTCIQQEHLTHANPAKKFSTPHLHTYLVHTHFLTEDDKHNITNTETKIYIY